MTTETLAASAAVIFFLTYKDPDIKAFPDLEAFKADFPDVDPITDEAGIETSDIPLEAIVAGFNKISPKKVRGFKSRKEGAGELARVLTNLIKSLNEPKPSAEEALTKALKPKKEPKERKAKEAGSAEGRNSPLSGKFWARSDAAIKGRRLGGSGVGIKALQYIIDHPGITTEEYLANSGGGRFVDLQYDLDYGNVVMLEGATQEERDAELAKLAAVRVGAEQAAQAKAVADEAAKLAKKAEKEKADEVKKAEKKAKADEAKKAADKVKAERTDAEKAADAAKAAKKA